MRSFRAGSTLISYVIVATRIKNIVNFFIKIRTTSKWMRGIWFYYILLETGARLGSVQNLRLKGGGHSGTPC